MFIDVHALIMISRHVLHSNGLHCESGIVISDSFATCSCTRDQAQFQLRSLMDGKYFSSLAKIVNTWRTRGNPQKIRQGLMTFHDLDVADPRGKRLPPRPLKGRWGSVTSTEQFMNNFTMKELSWIWKEKLPSTHVRKKRQDAIEQDDGDLGEDYSEKMSRWLRESLLSIQDINFWRSLHVSRISRSPLFHAQCWLEAGGSSEKHCKMPELVVTRCALIEREFEALLLPETLHTHWQPLLDLLDGPGEAQQEVVNGWMGHAAFHVLQMAANWHRRITRIVQVFPSKLLWLICEEPHVPSEARKLVCAEILSANDGVASKVAHIFGDTLVEGAQCGCIDPLLYDFVMEIAACWKPDVQEIEGTNNVVQHIGRISPNLSWPLLSARIMAKKKMALHPTRKEKIAFLESFPSRHCIMLPCMRL